MTWHFAAVSYSLRQKICKMNRRQAERVRRTVAGQTTPVTTSSTTMETAFVPPARAPTPPPSYDEACNGKGAC